MHRFQELDLSTQCLMGQESNREEPWVNTVEATLKKEGKYKRVSVWEVEGRVECVKGGGVGGICGDGGEGGVCGDGGEDGMCGRWREGWDVWGWRGRVGESGCVGVLGGCGSCVSLPAVVLCSSGGDTSAGVHQT